jgi:hypothetical protein
VIDERGDTGHHVGESDGERDVMMCTHFSYRNVVLRKGQLNDVVSESDGKRKTLACETQYRSKTPGGAGTHNSTMEDIIVGVLNDKGCT